MAACAYKEPRQHFYIQKSVSLHVPQLSSGSDLSRVAVSTAEFPPSRDGSDMLLIVNGKYVVSARAIDMQPGSIGMSEPQRTWMGVALTDILSVDFYDAFSQGSQAYLGSMDIEVGFASKNKTPQTPYDQDDLAKEVSKVSLQSALRELT
jgi:vesicle-fusing ATPase